MEPQKLSFMSFFRWFLIFSKETDSHALDTKGSIPDIKLRGQARHSVRHSVHEF